MLIILIAIALFAFGPFSARPANADDRREKALDAFNQGEALSWDQLEVVATEAGVSREKIAEMKLKDRAERLIRKYRLPLEISGFSEGMDPDEEFRLFKGRRPGYGALLFNADFWSKGAGVYDNDAFLSYLIFRAQAYYIYRTHYDSEHCAWIVGEESPSMQVLKTAIDGSQANWAADDNPPAGRDLEFRESLDPSRNASKTLRALIEYALRTVAQRASDDWALLRCRKQLGITPPLVTECIRRRERSLAADFSRARSAMTRSERLAFRDTLKSPFRYTRQAGTAASDPVYDSDAKSPQRQ